MCAGFRCATTAHRLLLKYLLDFYVPGKPKGIFVLDNIIHDVKTTALSCAANAFGLKVDGMRMATSIGGP